MERWVGKVAVVTGASSGIGAATVIELLKKGVIVVGLARRAERVEELRSQVDAKFAPNLHARSCDVSKEADILSTFAWVETALGGADILINNAGIVGGGNLVDKGNTELLHRVLDTNVIGLVQCTREAFQSMKARGVAGHIILIGSVTGHQVACVPGFGSMNIYAPSKFAVNAITEVLRQEFNNLGTKIKISSISPGGVATEIVPQEYIDNAPFPFMESVDIANAILYVLGTPPHVQVHSMIIKPNGEPF